MTISLYRLGAKEDNVSIEILLTSPKRLKKEFHMKQF